MEESTICWHCKHAVPKFDEKEQVYTRGCEWSIYKQPVLGWIAINAEFNYERGNKNFQHSYNVRHCPKFEKG